MNVKTHTLCVENMELQVRLLEKGTVYRLIKKNLTLKGDRALAQRGQIQICSLLPHGKKDATHESTEWKEADAKEADSVLSKANAKFDETIALLKQDLSDTENRIAQKQQEVTDAENAVVAARKGVLEALKLRESAPQVLAEKEKALAAAKAKHGASKASFDAFKAKFDQQASVTEDLLKKYLDALPK